MVVALMGATARIHRSSGPAGPLVLQTSNVRRREQKGFYKRAKLPHFDKLDEVQFITYRLADSLPKEALQRISDLPTDKRTPRILQWLDGGHGCCHLRNPAIAKIVQENLLHFDGERYNLIAWAIMPNHVHALIECNVQWQLGRIVQSWKSYTSKMANEVLESRGQFWQPDYFDRAARHQDEVAAIAQYIEHNPVAARLVSNPLDWPFCSAGCRGSLCC
jgi:REP element-mobilizing transposase RayT